RRKTIRKRGENSLLRSRRAACRLRNGITIASARSWRGNKTKKKRHCRITWVPNAAASLLTTVTDYATFLTHVAWPKGTAPEIKLPTYAAMMKPQVRINQELAWGLGWGLQDDEGERHMWQWGDNGAWKNFVMVHAES